MCGLVFQLYHLLADGEHFRGLTDSSRLYLGESNSHSRACGHEELGAAAFPVSCHPCLAAEPLPGAGGGQGARGPAPPQPPAH